MAALANADVLTDADVIVEETTKAEAEAMGALAFFEDKYGEQVRVVRAGPHSIELCGGTHVGALGMIGPITVISESSIGSNIRRLVRGHRAPAPSTGSWPGEGLLAEAAALLRTEPEHVPEAIDRLLERQRAAEKSLEQARTRSSRPRPPRWPPPPSTGWWWPAATASSPTSCGTWPRRPGPSPAPRGGARRQPRRHQGRLAVSADRSADASGGRRSAGQGDRPAPRGRRRGLPEMAVAGGKDPVVSTGPSTRPDASSARR